MLMADPVFIEQFRHFFSNHVPIVRHGHQRYFFPLGGRRFWLFRCWLIHRVSIHHPPVRVGYSKASRSDFSLKGCAQDVQVTK